jgi:ribosome production factor 2
MRDIALLRGFQDQTKMFLRKTVDTHPFDDVGALEHRCVKHDTSLFLVSQNQKKRPENLIFGRIYAEHLLDMFEFGCSNFQPIKNFKALDVDNQTKPLMVFQGEQFEFSEKHSRFKNFLLDLFRISDYDEINIAEFKRVMVVTAVSESKIEFRHYELNPGRPINETEVKTRSLTFSEIGPRFDLTFRRDKIASHELFKTACKKPKVLNPEKKAQKKNLFTDALGQQMGKVYLQQQDISTLATKKIKKPKGPAKETKVEAADV